MKTVRLMSLLMLVTVVAMFTVSCEKSEELDGIEPGSEESNLVSYELKCCIPAREAAGVLKDSMSIEAPVFGEIDLEQYGIQLKAYRITYNTKDVRGNSIVLSGDICYIDGGLSCKRILESVSLFHPAFATSEKHCCEYEQYAFLGRSMHNALVVYPHYQGFFAGSNYVVTVSESLLKARQAIDCELAALELVDKLEDVDMSPCYYTENMGISCGTGATLATHYLLENDKELKEVNKKYIRLSSSYCCEGPYKYSELITYLANEFPYEDLQDAEDFSQVAYISIVVGTFDTWKGMSDPNGSEYFKGIDDVREYFNPALFERDDLVDGSTVVKDVVQYFREGKLDHHTKMFKRAGLSSREMVNPAFFTEDGKLDENNELVKALYYAMSQNEVIADGWHPTIPVTISHCVSDELCPFDQAVSVYHSLSKYGLNPCVKFNTIFSLEHTDANIFFAVRDIIIKKHPA